MKPTAEPISSIRCDQLLDWMKSNLKRACSEPLRRGRRPNAVKGFLSKFDQFDMAANGMLCCVDQILRTEEAVHVVQSIAIACRLFKLKIDHVDASNTLFFKGNAISNERRNKIFILFKDA
jgi:hypothetical protein